MFMIGCVGDFIAASLMIDLPLLVSRAQECQSALWQLTRHLVSDRLLDLQGEIARQGLVSRTWSAGSQALSV